MGYDGEFHNDGEEVLDREANQSMFDNADEGVADPTVRAPYDPAELMAGAEAKILSFLDELNSYWKGDGNGSYRKSIYGSLDGIISHQSKASFHISVYAGSFLFGLLFTLLIVLITVAPAMFDNTDGEGMSLIPLLSPTPWFFAQGVLGALVGALAMLALVRNKQSSIGEELSDRCGDIRTKLARFVSRVGGVASTETNKVEITVSRVDSFYPSGVALKKAALNWYVLSFLVHYLQREWDDDVQNWQDIRLLPKYRGPRITKRLVVLAIALFFTVGALAYSFSPILIGGPQNETLLTPLHVISGCLAILSVASLVLSLSQGKSFEMIGNRILVEVTQSLACHRKSRAVEQLRLPIDKIIPLLNKDEKEDLESWMPHFEEEFLAAKIKETNGDREAAYVIMNQEKRLYVGGEENLKFVVAKYDVFEKLLSKLPERK